MKKYIKIGFIFLPFLLPLSLISCGESTEYDSNKMLETYINWSVDGNSIKNSNDKEIIAFKSETPKGVNLKAGMGFVYYQMRSGLIGTAKVELMHSRDSLDRDIYFGKRWRVDLGGVISTNFNLKNTQKYDNWIEQFFSDWAISNPKERENARAYKLTPVEISYDSFFNPQNTPEYK